MRAATLEIIVWIIGSVYFILTPHLASSTLAGSNRSICERNIKRTELQNESNTKWNWKWWGIFPYFWLDTEIKSVNKTIDTVEQICCDGFININQTCLPEDHIKSNQEVCNYFLSSFICNYVPSESISDLKECSNIAVEYNLALENSKSLSERCNHDKNCTASRLETCSLSCEPECENGWCTDENVCACHPNFRINDTGTKCVPLCDKECKHGHCVAKNKCDCSKGWEGALCNVALLCRLVENDEENRDLPICHSGCRENINGTMILERQTILINSTCNAEVMGFLIKHGQWIFSTAVLIVLVCFITCIACCIKKMKKPVDPSYGLELIPSTTTTHTEENHLYATIKTTF